MPLIDEMRPKADAVSSFLKGMANRDRLLILCHLADREHCVTDLIAATGIAPTSMSQHLAKLKAEGIVDVTRNHRTLTYRIANPAAMALMNVLYEHFCKQDA